MITGFTSRFKILRNSMKVEPVTRQPVNYGSEALEVKSHQYTYSLITTLVDNAATTSYIPTLDTLPAVYAGDIARFLSGDLAGLSFHILSSDSGSVTLATDMPSAPQFSDQVSIERFVPPSVSSLAGSTAPTPVAAGTPTRGRIVGTSITNAYTTLLTMGAAAKHMAFWNSTDQNLMITYDDGGTDNLELDAGEFYAVDFASLGTYLSDSVIKVKWLTAVPKVGSVRVVMIS